MRTETLNEHRKLIRFPVNVKVIDEAAGETLGYTSNMHVEGMMLKSFSGIRADTEYRIILEYLRPDDEIVEIRLIARCLWCKPAEHPDFHHSGFYFTNLSEEQKDMIVTLIRMMTMKT